MAVKRVNIRISESMHQWFMERSEDTGIPMSSLMAIALEEYVIQREAITGVSNVTKIMQEKKKVTRIGEVILK